MKIRDRKRNDWWIFEFPIHFNIEYEFKLLHNDLSRYSERWGSFTCNKYQEGNQAGCSGSQEKIFRLDKTIDRPLKNVNLKLNKSLCFTNPYFSTRLLNVNFSCPERMQNIKRLKTLSKIFASRYQTTKLLYIVLFLIG